MYKLCKTEQSAQRQRQLEEGLLTAMKTKRYEEITISDLCEQMGIPRKSFYRYFSSKDGALHALIDHTLLDFEQHTGILSGNAAGDAHQDLRHFFEFWHRRKQLLDALERSGLSGVLIQRAISYSRELDTLPRFMVISDRHLRDYGTMYAVVGMMTMLVQWYHDGFQPGVEQMAGLVIRLMSEPLFSPMSEK